MINEAELRILLADLESDRVERTTSTNDTAKFSEAVCAFANDLPHYQQSGYLIIGAKDNGEIVGVHVTDELLRNLGGLRSDGNIQPLPHITVQKITLDGKDLAVVEVHPSHTTPVRYKGNIYVRVGPRKTKASHQEERVLTEKWISSVRTLDASPVNGASLDDLSLALFAAYRQQAIAPEVIAENGRDIKEQLASLRFYDLRKDCPTYAGILLFGKNPRYFLPGAYVQYLRIEGTTLTDPVIDQAEIQGDLLFILRELDVRIKTNIHTTLVRETALREKAVYDYPEWSVRELLMNAIMHRDYQSNAPIRLYWFSDHIEIQSNGGLYGGVTLEMLGRVVEYRNPVIAEALKTLGYVNRYGYGIQNAQRLLQENGNPLATFEAGVSFHCLIYQRNNYT